MKRRQVRIGVLSCVIVTSFFLTSCSSSPSEEQMRQLNDLKQEQAALQQQVTQKEQQKAAVEREISAKNAKLKKCNDDKQVVQARLSK